MKPCELCYRHRRAVAGPVCRSRWKAAAVSQLVLRVQRVLVIPGPPNCNQVGRHVKPKTVAGECVAWY